ncbi:hypothetical protein GJQ54_04700 [Oceanospirillaceae bacterium ASx5O]|nr:hypothetical protein GJQ54_04700 [Oceanospirillaceae bacterium ASx5O]
MRKSIDCLVLLVEKAMALNPMQPVLIVFCNCGQDKIKILPPSPHAWSSSAHSPPLCGFVAGCAGRLAVVPSSLWIRLRLLCRFCGR